LRLVFHRDIMGDDGLVLVSSDEELLVEEIAVASDEDMPVGGLRRSKIAKESVQGMMSR